MRNILLAALAVAPIAACATAPDASAPGSTKVADSGNIAMPFVEIFGTPFYWAVKAPLCAVSIAVALPVAGASELTGSADPGGHELRRSLNDGLGQACGPPYVLTP